MEGTPFGRYRLVELLGSGRMGEVWQAFDTLTQRRVAVKVLRADLADDQTFQARFWSEARAAAGLDEPHAVPIHDFGEIDGRFFVAMRLITGQDLDTLLTPGPLPAARAVSIIEQVAAALEAAHRAGLVHRDVTPSNILLTSGDFAYLIDFGIANAAGDTSVTNTSVTVGKWSYMAPERFRAGPIGSTVDVYALTCVLFQCLTGQAPFPGSTLDQVATGHMTTPPPKPSSYQLAIPPAMDEVIARGMAKDPAQRYRTTEELARAARAAVTMFAPDGTWTRPTEAHGVADARRTPYRDDSSTTQQAPRDPGRDESPPSKYAVRRPWAVNAAVALAFSCAALIAADVVYSAFSLSHGARRSAPAYIAAVLDGYVVLVVFLVWAALLAWRGSSRRPLRFTALVFLLFTVVIGAAAAMERGLLKAFGVVALWGILLFVFGLPISLLLATRSSEDFFKGRGTKGAASSFSLNRLRSWRSALPIAAVLLVMAAIPVGVSHLAGGPFWAKPPDLSTLLLNVQEIDTLVGATGLAIRDAGEAPDDATVTTPPECDAAASAYGIREYGSSGFAAMQWQLLTNPSKSNIVHQAVTQFNSPEIASEFVLKLGPLFESCRGRSFDQRVRVSGSEFQGIVDAVTTGPSVLSARHHLVGSTGWCQHVIQPALSFVIEAVVCGTHINDEAVQLASAIAARTGAG